MAVACNDGALSLFLGLVCATCDAYNDPGTALCMSCGATLQVDDDRGDAFIDALETPVVTDAPSQVIAPSSSSAGAAPPSWMNPPIGNQVSTGLAMKMVEEATVSSVNDRDVPSPSPAVLTPALSESLTHPYPLRALPTAPTTTTAGRPNAIDQPLPSTPLPSTPRLRPVCAACTNELEPSDRFCRQCGAPTEGVPATSKALPTPAQAAATAMAEAARVPSLAVDVSAVHVSAAGATMVLSALSLDAGVSSPQAPPPHGATTTMMFGAAHIERAAKLILVRGQSRFGSQWRLQAGETVIGRSNGMVLFPEDHAVAPRHARLVFRGIDLFIEPEPTQNGTYVRLRDSMRLSDGDEFVIGAQRLQLQGHADIDRAPVADSGDTRFQGSYVKPSPPMVINRIGSDARFHETYFRAQRLLTIGRVHCDVNFSGDPFVSERHAQLTNEGTHVTLEDLKSRNGTYFRVRQPTKLLHGDLILIGEQVLRIELPQR